MKRPISLLLGLCLLFIAFLPNNALSQDQDNQLMMVSIDKVKPAHLMEYEKAVKDFNAKHMAAKVKSVKWWGNQQEGFTYVYGIPVKDMASLDKDYWAESNQKLSKPEMKKMFDNMNKHIISNELLMYMRVSALAYEHNSFSKGGDYNYREWTSYEFKPGISEEVSQLAADWKKLYTENNLEASYRIYKCVFGDVDTWVVMNRAKDAKHLAEMEEKANKVVLQKGQELIKRMNKMLVSEDRKVGMYRADLSYIPATETAPVSSTDNDK